MVFEAASGAAEQAEQFSAGVYILHNTSFTSGTVGTNITSGANVHVHNSLFLGCGGPALHAGVLAPAVSTWDYNGYTDSDDVQVKVPQHRPVRSFRELQDKFGYEKHGVEVGYHDLSVCKPREKWTERYRR